MTIEVRPLRHLEHLFCRRSLTAVRWTRTGLRLGCRRTAASSVNSTRAATALPSNVRNGRMSGTVECQERLGEVQGMVADLNRFVGQVCAMCR
jgi:hypothetical protein